MAGFKSSLYGLRDVLYEILIQVALYDFRVHIQIDGQSSIYYITFLFEPI